MMRSRIAFIVLVAMLVSLLGPGRVLASGLAATPDSLEFNLNVGASATQSVTVTGAGANLQASADKPYITTAVSSTGGTATVHVTVNAGGLPSGTSDLAVLTLTAGSATLQVPVAVNVSGTGTGGTALTASPPRLDAGTVAPGSKQTLKVKVSSTAAGSVSGTIASTQPWIKVMPSQLTSSTQTVLVLVDTSGMTPGSTSSGSLRIDAGAAGALEIPVLVSISSPSAPPETITASPFSDVPMDHWALKAVVHMQKLKVLAGFADGTFGPDLSVTREQFAKVLVAALQLPLVNPPAAPSFADVPADRWSFLYVETARPYLTSFADGLFRPTLPATREDIAAALVRAEGLDKTAPPDPSELDVMFSDAAAVSSSLRILVTRAVKAGLISGFEDHTFRPQATLTRAQTAVLLDRALNLASLAVKTAPGGTIPNPPLGPNPTGNGGAPGTTPGTPGQASPPTGLPGGTTTPSDPASTPPTSDNAGSGPAAGVPDLLAGTYRMGTAPTAWPSKREIPISTLAGGTAPGNTDGPLASARFGDLRRVTVGPNGAVYVAMGNQWKCADCHGISIRKIQNGQVSTVLTLPDRDEIADLAVGNNYLLLAYRTTDKTGTYWTVLRHRYDGSPDDVEQVGDPFWYIGSVDGAWFYHLATGDWYFHSEAGRAAYIHPDNTPMIATSDLHSNSFNGRLLGENDGRTTFIVQLSGQILQESPGASGSGYSTLVSVYSGFTFAVANNRAGTFMLTGDKLYRFTLGDKAIAELLDLTVANYGTDAGTSGSDVADMRADGKGNIVYLDRGNNSVRYIRIFP